MNCGKVVMDDLKETLGPLAPVIAVGLTMGLTFYVIFKISQKVFRKEIPTAAHAEKAIEDVKEAIAEAKEATEHVAKADEDIKEALVDVEKALEKLLLKKRKLQKLQRKKIL